MNDFSMDKNDPDTFYTVGDKIQSVELKVKGSKFIANVIHAPNKIIADTKYQQIKKKYHDATHNCYAYRITDNDFRYSDDGEPSGTAGLPIFKVLENHEIFEVLLIVTRYFGGTKLGTGGLARAYSDAAMECIRSSKKIVKTKYVTINLQTTYARYNDLLRLVSKFNGKFKQSDYQDKIDLTLQIPKSRFNLFQTEFDQDFYDINNLKT
jgi:uncharacterized YigZ family protein